MKRVMEPIVVVTPFTPAWTLLWRDQTFRVESVMARWFYRGKWWLDPKLEGERRTYFRLSCSKLAAPKPEIRRRMNLHAAMYNGGVVAPPAAERIVEVFQRTREGVETWVMSGVVD